MCLIAIIEKPSKTVEKVLKLAAAQNQDGFGALWIDGKIRAYRGLHKGQEQPVLELYNRIKQFADKDNPVVMHLRMATSGTTGLSNAHPFPLGKNVYLMHNGVFRFENELFDRQESDTAFLVRMIKWKARKRPMNEVLDEMDPFFEKLGHDNRLVLWDGETFQWYGQWIEYAKGFLVSNTYSFRTAKEYKEYAYDPKTDYKYYVTDTKSSKEYGSFDHPSYPSAEFAYQSGDEVDVEFTEELNSAKQYGLDYPKEYEKDTVEALKKYREDTYGYESKGRNKVYYKWNSKEQRWEDQSKAKEIVALGKTEYPIYDTSHHAWLYKGNYTKEYPVMQNSVQEVYKDKKMDENGNSILIPYTVKFNK